MGAIPITRIPASKETAEEIRRTVRRCEGFGPLKVATGKDVTALHNLIADPAVHAPVYTLPKPVTEDAVSAFIADHLQQRSRGEGLLLIGYDHTGAAGGYQDIQFWPEWAACELGGAIRRDRQSAGEGGLGAALAFDWLFETIGVNLICETAALDNERTARLLERLGFTCRGKIESTLPGGGVRPSRVWETTRDEWRRRRNACAQTES